MNKSEINKIEMNDSFDDDLNLINKSFEELEDLYNLDFINLKQYYEIKGNIISKLICFSKEEIEKINDSL